ncbi:MAG: ABC transporter substrate-binding protein [Anaerolineaceae bacterium]|nr:ABC transporter substrate-binding protein [Anaerolineaceae bacterium]
MKNRFTKIIVVIFLIVLTMSACQKKEAEVLNIPVETNQNEVSIAYPVKDNNEETNYFPEIMQTEYAQGFIIEYHTNYKILTVTQPWSGAKQVFSYVLVQRGTEVPDTVLENSLVIEVPIRSIVTMSTTYFPYLEKFKLMDSLVGVDDTTYIYNEMVQDMAERGILNIIGGGAGGGAVNVEALIDLAADVIMTSASGIPEYDAHPKLIEAGLPVVINADYLENTPLGRAEWGKFIAAFYNLESEANREFSMVVDRYNALVSLTSDITDKPAVFTNTDFQGSWYVPGGQSYAAILLKDAGATYLWADDESTGANPLSFEEVYDKAADAEYWLNVGFAGDLTSLLAMDERYFDFSAFQNGKVFNYTNRVNAYGGSDYFESGVANPDVILADLIAIFHPQLLPEHMLFYYKQLQ